TSSFFVTASVRLRKLSSVGRRYGAPQTYHPQSWKSPSHATRRSARQDLSWHHAYILRSHARPAGRDSPCALGGSLWSANGDSIFVPRFLLFIKDVLACNLFVSHPTI